MCNSCELWRRDEQTDYAKINIPESVRVVNLIGGDPLYYSELLKLLAKLKEQRKIICLTSNGLNFVKTAPELFKLIDLPIIYLPAWRRDQLLAEAGLDYYRELSGIFDYLQEIGQKCLVIFPVRMLTLEDIPDLIDWFKKYSSVLLVLYYQAAPDNVLQKESLRYLDYCRQKKNVVVYKVLRPEPSVAQRCAGCLAGLEFWSLPMLRFGLELLLKLYF